MADEVDVVTAWHRALNAADPDGVAELTDESVEVGGPRGTGHGVALVHEWADRAGVRLDPKRVFHRGDVVVVEEVARWRDPTTGAWGDPSVVASGFLVAGGLVRRVVRFEGLAAALASSGLDTRDEVVSEESARRIGRDAAS
jgi:hypothetical protein